MSQAVALTGDVIGLSRQNLKKHPVSSVPNSVNPQMVFFAGVIPLIVEKDVVVV